MARPSLFQSPLLAQLQTQIQAQIKDPLGQRLRTMTGATGDARDFLQPAGDPGLFGPDSADWQVHAHFVAMMTGGLSTLMLQALHPRALAAVWDHSSHAGAPTQLRTGKAAVRTALQGAGASLAWAFADTGVAARARQSMASGLKAAESSRGI